MRLPRSTFYDVPAAPVGDVALVAKIVVICDEFETYGYRRVRAKLRRQGFCQRQEDPQAHARERPATQAPPTVRHHDQQRSRESDFPDLARDQKTDGPDQLWAAGITYITIETGFVYLAVILDAWSRRVVGYAISRSIDARLAIAALKSAIRERDPPKGRIHHSDRGSQYASADYRNLLTAHGLVGSMSRRGNPYDNAMAESFMKTLKVEAVY
jgi:putative transposase